MTGLHQKAPRDLANRRIVLGQQHTKTKGHLRDRLHVRTGRLFRPLRWAKQHPKVAAPTNLRPHLDAAAMSLGHGIHGRQAESRADTRCLGREEGLERAAPNLVAHAAARVRHLEGDVAARHGQPEASGLACVNRASGKVEVQTTSFRHGITCVDAQIDDDLLQLAFVSPDLEPAAAHVDFDENVLAKQPSQERKHAVHESVQGNALGLTDIPAEGEQLPDEGSSALSRLPDLPEGGS